MRHDIVIIGGGSAGYAAARSGRDAGANVAIVDQGPLGGLCILRGCMPTKTILRSSDIMALMRRAAEFGLRPVEVHADMAAIMARKEELISGFAEYRIEQLHDPYFTLYQEQAIFLSPHTVQVGAKIIEADQFIVATGSVAQHIAIPGIDAVGYITSDEALQLQQSPKSMLVLGGGAVATELAQFFQRTGTQVTLIQRSQHILSEGDEDLARPVEAHFREEGMQVFTNTQLHQFTVEGSQKIAHFTHDEEQKSARAEVVLQALGRRPNVDGLDLNAAGVQVERGRVLVNAEMRTNQPHIFAVGDVNGIHEIVHIAIQQGEVAGHNAAYPGRPPHRMDDRLKAQVVFTDPQVANVGLREKECQQQGMPYLVASYPFDDHGKSLTLGEIHGHVKLLCEPRTGKILGGHIVGPEAGELVHELVAVMYFHGTVRDLAQIPHYHPTLAEIITYPAEELAEQIG